MAKNQGRSSRNYNYPQIWVASLCRTWYSITGPVTHATAGYGYHAYLKRETCIDSWACFPHSPWSLVTCDVNKINPEVKSNLIIYNSVRVWHDLTKYVGQNNIKSLLSPITQNPDFPAGVGSSVFSSWQNRGIRVIGDLFKDNILMSFQQLPVIFDVPKQHFFAFLQLRHFISSQVTLSPADSYSNYIEKFILERENGKHFISAFYSLLGSFNVYDLPNISRKWEKDLDTEYIEDDWQAAIRLINSTFTCNRLRETLYKTLHRLHITPVILHKMNHSFSPICIKCRSDRATYFHCFWECKMISRFWTSISTVISGIFKLQN